MIDPVLATLATSVFEKAINKALQYDPGTRAKLTSLSGKTFVIDCKNPQLCISMVVEHDQLSFKPVKVDEPDVTIEGELYDLATLAYRDIHSLADSNVSVSGKVGVLSEFQALLKTLEIDWEALIVEVLGPVAGHLLAEHLRAKFSYVKNRASDLTKALPQIITDELKLSPHPREQEEFFDDVAKLRSDVTRLGARIKRIAEQFSQNPQ